LTRLGETAAFGSKLRKAINDFRGTEDLARQQYRRAPDAPEVSNDVLERTTRRFLIDPFLEALDWCPGKIESLPEEARAKFGKNRLYFDYLGLEPKTRTPVMLFEAKGFDIEPPRRAWEATPTAHEMASVIADAVDALKGGDTTIPVISAWAEFLGDMRTYVRSLGEQGRTTLKRAVISSGQWIVVFTDPWAVFGEPGATNVELIRCYSGFDDILARKDELYDLLHRSRLVDTLALTLEVSEALEMFDGKQFDDCFRGALVTTSVEAGARKQPFPARLVYPALVISTGGRRFAIVDLKRHVIEPVYDEAERISEFLAKLEIAGSEMEGLLSKFFGKSLAPLPIEQFQGFENRSADTAKGASALAPIAGSTALIRKDEIKTPKFVTHSGEAGAPAEFIVVTGEARFYKFDHQRGSMCLFHSRREARKAKVETAEAHKAYVLTSFTDEDQDRHCAHGVLVKMRNDRCQVDAIDTHLCCQACLFTDLCWPNADARGRLPCPPDAHPATSPAPTPDARLQPVTGGPEGMARGLDL
jgi:hypothetical protein